MKGESGNETLLEMFVYETGQLIEQMEQCLLETEMHNSLKQSIHDIFRIVHTIKGSAGMMMFDRIASLAHSLEDLYDFIRKSNKAELDLPSIVDISLKSLDYVKNELVKIRAGEPNDGDPALLCAGVRMLLASLMEEPVKKANPFYSIRLFFEENCGMEGLRAFEVIHKLESIAYDIRHEPEDVIGSDDADTSIARDGLFITFTSDKPRESIEGLLSDTLLLRDMDVQVRHLQSKGKAEEADPETGCWEDEPNSSENLAGGDEIIPQGGTSDTSNQIKADKAEAGHSLISVHVNKLDLLMDTVGELVIAQALVTHHPELKQVILSDFYKASRQLQKITDELQDIVMSIRMVSLSLTFHKMYRLVRDINRKLGKEVELEIQGEETEVDKSIIEQIADPLMHLIRNAMDHGIESPQERLSANKPEKGRISLEAKNVGSEVWIIVKDDGRGLDRDKILAKARERGLMVKPEAEYTEKEVYTILFHPGFSTKESVTEFSGRGVGMDVVLRNIEKIRGSVVMDSQFGKSTTVTIKIPLTLAIIQGLTIGVGSNKYTIPMLSVKETFRVNAEQIFKDITGEEMILIRGQCFPVLRLKSYYHLSEGETELKNGMIIIVENESQSLCLFADALIGEQQVVVKALPAYIKKVKGVTGCTLLGDGSISLILDVVALIDLAP